jgi:hypothetical protein
MAGVEQQRHPFLGAAAATLILLLVLWLLMRGGPASDAPESLPGIATATGEASPHTDSAGATAPEDLPATPGSRSTTEGPADVTPAATPVEAAELTGWLECATRDADWTAFTVAAGGTTAAVGSDARFRIPVPAPGRYEVRVSAGPLPLTSASLVTGFSQRIGLPPGRARAIATTSEGRPVGVPLRLRFHGARRDRYADAETDAVSGRLALPHVPTGWSRLWVVPQGRWRRNSHWLIQQHSDPLLTIELAPPNPLRIHTRWPEGARGEMLLFLYKKLEWRGPITGAVSEVPPRFDFDDQTLRLVVHGDGSASDDDDGLIAYEGPCPGSAESDVQVSSPLQRVAVRVQHADGRPLRNGTLFVTPADVRSQPAWRTQSQKWSLDGAGETTCWLPHGKWRLIGGVRWGREIEATVTVPMEEPTVVLTLDAALIRAKLRLRRAGRPVPHRWARFAHFWPGVLMQADAQGIVEVELLKAGDYSVVVSGEHWIARGSSHDVTLSDGAVIDLELPPPGTLVVRPGDGAPAGALVRVSRQEHLRLGPDGLVPNGTPWSRTVRLGREARFTLAAGDYVVRALSAGDVNPGQTVQIAGGQETTAVVAFRRAGSVRLAAVPARERHQRGDHLVYELLDPGESERVRWRGRVLEGEAAGPVVPGRYLVRVRFVTHRGRTSYTVDEEVVWEGTVDVTPGEVTELR